MTRFVRSGFRRALLLCSSLLLAVTGVVAAVDVAQGSGPSSGPQTPTYNVGPADIDHFGCYVASAVSPLASVPGPTFKVPPAVELSNQFSPGFITAVGKLVFHCNPTRKTTTAGVVTPIVNPLTHMACFSLPALTPATTAVGSIQPPHTVTVTNQFGTGTLTTGQPRVLCLPTWKNLPAPATQSQPPGLDHYVCYAVSNAANMPKPPAVVTLQDQFNAAQSPPTTTKAYLNTPNLMCLPSLKSPISPLVGPLPGKLFHPEAHLLCYPVIRSVVSPPAPGGSVKDQNQFGIGQVAIKQLSELCVPSYKTVVGPSNTLVITKLGVDPASGVGVPLAGATFSATPSVAGNPSGTCTTDGSGSCVINGLATDTYTVSETSPPPGYVGGPDESATFTTSPQTIALTFNDTPDPNANLNTIDITKTTNPNAAGGGTPLAGATFTAVGALATSPTGSCTTSAAGTCQITGLAVDTYTVSETVAPVGYSPAPPQTLTFTTSPQTLSLGFFDSLLPPGPLDTLVIKKYGIGVNGGAVLLPGATFVATPSVATNPSGTCTTVATGMCTMTGLAIDTYTVIETVVPAGYSPAAPQTVTFTIAPQTLLSVFKDPATVGVP